MKHTLKYEGAPHDDQGNRIVLGRWAGVGGVGRAKCRCGDLSPELGSSKMRQAWFRRHKHLKQVEDFLSMEDEGQLWPFVEDDRANITGYGHQDKEAFARLVTEYDRSIWDPGLTDDDGFWTAEQVGHKYATFEFVEEDLANIRTRTDDDQPITPDTHPDCVPITTIWGQR